MRMKFLLLICFAFCISCAAHANNGLEEKNDVKRKDEINGGVFHSETKKPLNNVSVTAYLSSKKEKVVLSDGNGNYAFDGLKPGTYRIVFEKDGYKKVTKDKVLIKTDEGFQLNIEMTEEKDFDFMPGAFGF